MYRYCFAGAVAQALTSTKKPRLMRGLEGLNDVSSRQK